MSIPTYNTLSVNYHICPKLYHVVPQYLCLSQFIRYVPYVYLNDTIYPNMTLVCSFLPCFIPYDPTMYLNSRICPVKSHGVHLLYLKSLITHLYHSLSILNIINPQIPPTFVPKPII
jgi:hypothetical protein